MYKKKNIGELLIDFGKISKDDLEEGLALQKEFNLRLGETLIKLGKVTRDDIEWVLSKQLDIPFVIVENISLDASLIHKFSEELLLKNRILPLYETNDEIAVVTDDPLNREVIESLEASSSKKISLSSGNGEQIEETLKQFFRRAGIPSLIQHIKDLLEKIEGTCFYRLDFLLGEHACEMNVFGYGIVKNIGVLRDTYTKEQIFEAFESLGIAFLFDLYTNETSMMFSIYPLIHRLETLKGPAVLGTFGLFHPDDTAFTDSQMQGLPLMFHSPVPVRGYPFIATKKTFSYSENTIFTTDSAPEDFSNYYVRIAVPRICRNCNGAGCITCNELGYEFPEKLEGMHSSDELKQRTEKDIPWPK
ncbi:MAG: hypothetical protein RDU01_04235 [Thermodesulfovibrionales bacterium]|nr:hypothetical protein [Thermodesulfovibrionales bacterium]